MTFRRTILILASVAWLAGCTSVNPQDGQVCVGGGDCSSGLCFLLDDGVYHCTDWCNTNQQCPAGWLCNLSGQSADAATSSIALGPGGFCDYGPDSGVINNAAATDDASVINDASVITDAGVVDDAGVTN